jgi:hypothetical protein
MEIARLADVLSYPWAPFGRKEMKTIRIIMVIILGGVFMLINLSMVEAGNSSTRIIRQQGLEVRLDLSTQVLGLDIPEEREWGQTLGKVEAELYPTIKSVPRRDDFVSASIMVAKAKQFDDGLYAAVEYLSQNGADGFMGKRELLRRVAEALKGLANDKEMKGERLKESRSFIQAAANLGGQAMAGAKEIQLRAEEIRAKFLSDKLKSKPISFYTWTEELTRIFQQDRLLQEPLDPEQVSELTQGLSKDATALKAYQAYLSFVKKLTNPFPPEFSALSPILNIEKEKKYSFFPPSQAPETELVKKLYRNRPIPEGFNLLDELVKEIQKKAVDLTPREDSGWYAHQIYALEPFANPELMPEAKKLYFGEKYKKELIDLFKASLALTRETHIKQLEIPMAGAAPFDRSIPIIEIFPELSAEPMATYYLRRAESYRFVRELLASAFGDGVLKNTRRLTARGRVSRALLEELREMESLFLGACQVVAEEIGMDPQLPQRSKAEREGDKKLAREWIRQFAIDPDVGADNRMMVPVFYDLQRQKTKVWVVLGYAVKPLSIWFKNEPQAEVLDARGKKAQAKLKFQDIQKPLIYPVSAEVYVKTVMNRDEFRALCNKYKTPSAILNALKNL